jgi:hypothetical protein
VSGSDRSRCESVGDKGSPKGTPYCFSRARRRQRGKAADAASFTWPWRGFRTIRVKDAATSEFKPRPTVLDGGRAPAPVYARLSAGPSWPLPRLNVSQRHLQVAVETPPGKDGRVGLAAGLGAVRLRLANCYNGSISLSVSFLRSSCLAPLIARVTRDKGIIVNRELYKPLSLLHQTSMMDYRGPLNSYRIFSFS